MTNKITISDSILEHCPNMQLGILECKVVFQSQNKELANKINEVCEAIAKNTIVQQISKIPIIADSRQAYKKFGKDPARYRLSSEALLRRVVSGKGLYHINNIVDTLNLISIQSGYSIGGYNLDRISGNIEVGVGKEGEDYQGIGRGDLNIENMPVLRDEESAFGTPTSDSVRTSVDDSIQQFLMVFYDFGGQTDLHQILELSKQQYSLYCQATEFATQIITK